MASDQRRRRLDPDTPVAPYVGFRIKPDMLDAIDRRAAEEGRSRSQMIRRLVDLALAQDHEARAS